jgi:hypothetical protein
MPTVSEAFIVSSRAVFVGRLTGGAGREGISCPLGLSAPLAMTAMRSRWIAGTRAVPDPRQRQQRVAI